MQRKFVFWSVFVLVLAVVILLSMGIVMLTSTGAFAQDNKGDPNYYLKRQLLWLGVGMLLCVIMAALDYRYLQKGWWLLYIGAAVLLVACFIPGIGAKLNGSHRWIRFGGQTLQPSELGKIAVVVALAWWFARKESDPLSFKKGFMIPLMGAGFIVALIAPEVDLGTSALIGGTTLIMMFVAGTRMPYLIALAGAGALGLAAAIRFVPERTGRFLAFMQPEKYADDAYQQMQGLIAFASGGIHGLGLGQGKQKFAYLPYAHTDFIFPMVGEEMGLLFTLLINVCFLLVLLAGAVIALRSQDRFGALLGFGLVSLLTLQAIVNIGVTTMLLPNKGLPLPFISYGGSNLALSLGIVGILISIYIRGFGEKSDPDGVRLQAKIKHRRTPRI